MKPNEHNGIFFETVTIIQHYVLISNSVTKDENMQILRYINTSLKRFKWVVSFSSKKIYTITNNHGHGGKVMNLLE